MFCRWSLTVLSEALSAVHRAAGSRLEGNLCGSTALRADRIIHLTGRAIAITLGFAGRTAALAAGGFVGETFLGIEFLFTSGEYKFLSTISTNERFVLVHGIIYLALILFALLLENMPPEQPEYEPGANGFFHVPPELRKSPDAKARNPVA